MIDFDGKIDYTYKVMFYDLLKYHQNSCEIVPLVGTVFALSNTHLHPNFFDKPDAVLPWQNCQETRRSRVSTHRHLFFLKHRLCSYSGEKFAQITR
jgi:hypothetical protein